MLSTLTQVVSLSIPLVQSLTANLHKYPCAVNEKPGDDETLFLSEQSVLINGVSDAVGKEAKKQWAARRSKLKISRHCVRVKVKTF